MRRANNRRHRKQAISWFLTFSQMGENRPIDPEMSLELFLEYMRERLPSKPVVGAILCHEDHAEKIDHKGERMHGGVHIHIAFKLQSQWECPADMQFFDDLFGVHPRIETARDWQDVVLYCGRNFFMLIKFKFRQYFFFGGKNKKNIIAADGDFATENVDVDSIRKAKQSKKGQRHNEIANKIREGITVEQLIDSEPGFVMMNYDKIAKFINLLDTFKHVPLKTLVAATPQHEGVLPIQEIAEWVTDTFITKTNKNMHLYIYGHTGIGKSHFVNQLRQFVKLFPVPYDADWFDNFNSTYQAAVFEEFNAHYTLTFLNSFLDPYQQSIRRRGLPPLIREGFLPCIFLSNCKPEEIYHVSCKARDGQSPNPVFVAFARRIRIVSCGENDIRINLQEQAEPEDMQADFSSEEMDDDLFGESQEANLFEEENSLEEISF